MMKEITPKLWLLILLLHFTLCIGSVCDEDKWFCMDSVPVSQCKPCERNHLSSNVGNELLNFINKFVCLSNIIQQPCVRGCVSPRTYCNAMYKSIPKTIFNVSLKMDISVKLVNRKHSQFLGAFGICDKLRRNPLCLLEAKVEAGKNFESLHVCINVCSDGTCDLFERQKANGRCQSNFNVPLKTVTVGNQNMISLLLTLDKSNNKVYLCIIDEIKQGIRDLKCIAQIDFLLSQVVFDLRTKTSEKDLYFLIHHHDQTYFNFNSNYLSIDSIYIYEDNLANRFKQPKVSKTIERVNKLVEDFYNTGQGLCSNRNREFCEFPAYCNGKKQRCKTTSRSENNLVSSYLSKSQYVTFENTGTSFLNSVSVAIVNETKGSINLVSKSQQIVESVFVSGVSSSQGLEIIIKFHNFYQKFALSKNPSIRYTVKIQNIIGENCYYDQPPTLYFAYDQGVMNLGTLKTLPLNWDGIFIDGFEETLIVKDTYIECVAANSVVAYILSILFIILVIVAIILSIRFYFLRGENACIFLYTVYIKDTFNNSKMSEYLKCLQAKNNQNTTSNDTMTQILAHNDSGNENNFDPLHSEEADSTSRRLPTNIHTTYNSTEEEVDVINSIRNLYYDSAVK